MSIASRSKLRWQVPELHLDGSSAEHGVTEAAAVFLVTLDVEGDPVRVG
jgi:hypothetical protein